MELSTLRIGGSLPPELWNKLGMRLIPKLRMGKVVDLQVQATVEVSASDMENIRNEIRRALAELKIESWRFSDGDGS